MTLKSGGKKEISGKIVSVNISEETGTKKTPIGRGKLKKGWGFVGDAHASALSGSATLSHRQISLLSIESIEKMRDMGADVTPGSFGENLTTSGLDLPSIPVGSIICLPQPYASRDLRPGTYPKGVILEVTQIGKECHDRCAIYRSVGDCVMPREGIFARVISGGSISPGDHIVVSEKK